MSRPLITSDGCLVDASPVEVNPEFARLSLRGVLRIPVNDAVGGSIMDSPDLVEVIGRSGQAQVGLHLKRIGSDIELGDGVLEVPVEVLGLLGAQHERILEVIRSLSSTTSIEMGRLLLRRPEQALSSEAIASAIQRDELLLPEEAHVNEKGLITIPLSQLHYLLALENISHPEEVLRFLRLGKHGLRAVRDVDSRALPESIDPGRFFLGSMRISMGPYIAVIEPNMLVDGREDTGLFHLAPRVLDGIITTGIGVARQVELYNPGARPVATEDVRIPLRIYPGGEHLDQGASLINARTLRRGVQLSDVLKLDKDSSLLIRLMNSVGRNSQDEKPYAYVLGRNRGSKVAWRPTRNLQEAGLKSVATGVMARKEGHMNGDTPYSVKRVCLALSYVGGEQDHGALMVSQAFPDPSVMSALLEEGVAAFVAQDLRGSLDMFTPSGSNQAVKSGFNDLYFDWMRYAQFCQLEKRGASIRMVHPDMPGLPAHVREFHRGFWVRPEAKERFDAVDTVLAMYGSHVQAVDAVLAPQMGPFMLRMKALLGDKGAITHGKGPGVMLAADRAAAEAGLLRIGVGIGVEKLGQAPNFAPEAMVDFGDTDRLPRQKLLDDLSTISIFNIGGAGTLEEAAITLCSQKLGKNIVAPMIFVDPLGLNNGDHLFADLKRQIDVMVETHTISMEDGRVAQAQLLASHNAGYIHLVKSYDEAAEIIESYVKDPIGYYEKQKIPFEFAIGSYGTAQGTFAQTGFSSPHFLPRALLEDPETKRRLSFN